MKVVVSLVVHGMLGSRALEVDKSIIDYIINVLNDEEFYFGVDGKEVWLALFLKNKSFNVQETIHDTIIR